MTSRLCFSLSAPERPAIAHSLSAIALSDIGDPPRRSLQTCQPLTLSLDQRRQVKHALRHHLIRPTLQCTRLAFMPLQVFRGRVLNDNFFRDNDARPVVSCPVSSFNPLTAFARACCAVHLVDTRGLAPSLQRLTKALVTPSHWPMLSGLTPPIACEPEAWRN